MLRCVRTTLTLDDDVAALLDRVRKQRKAGLKTVINEALRRGLVSLSKPSKRGNFQTEAVSLGVCHLPNLDNIAEVLAVAESEGFR